MRAVTGIAQGIQ